MKKFTNVEAMVIIKNLLNLVIKDKKRFIGLKNKFKKSIEEVKIKDEWVHTIFFTNVSHDIVLEELNSAIESLTKYVERSAKKQKELSDILNGVSIPADNNKPKSVKKLVKDKSNSTNKKKTSATIENGSKENLLDIQVKEFIETLDDTNLSLLIHDISEAFANDSRLNITMNNWISKTSSKKDAAIGMLTSAYKRKPSNLKLKKTWYKKLEDSINGIDKKVISEEQVETKTKNKEEVKTKPSKKETVNKSIQEVTFYKNLLSKSVLKNFKKYSFRLNSALLLEAYGTQELIDNNLIIHSVDIDKSIKKYLDKYNTTDISVEAEFLEESVKSTYNRSKVFTQPHILNLLNMIKFSPGLSAETRTNLFSETNFLEEYKENILELSLLESYVLNRTIINNIISSNLLLKSEQDKLFIFRLIGEVILNCIGDYIVEIDTVEENKGEQISYNISPTEISFIFENTSFIIQKLDERFAAIHDAILTSNFTKLKTLVTTPTTLKENLKDLMGTKLFSDSEADVALKDIKIIDKKLFYKGREVKGRLNREFINHVMENNKTEIIKFKRFLDNCAMNPSNESVDELYDFIVLNNLKVTPAGTLILYKWVSSNYMDTYSGKFNNSPGLTLFMDRNNVNNNRNEHCSNGLHLCSYKYGKFGQKLLLCEVHPKNVVSIPSDCEWSKMRCCEYTVLLEITEYVITMDRTKDYISKTSNLHHNSKLLEIDLMKLYPEVVRIHSHNGFNNLQNRSKEDLLQLAFGDIKNIENINYERLDLSEEENQDLLNEEISECETMVESKEEPMVESKEEPMVESKEEPMVESKEEPELKDYRVILNFDKYFDKFMNREIINVYKFEFDSVEEFIQKSNKYDSVIMDSVFDILGLNRLNYKVKNELEVTTILNGYLKLKEDEISSTEINKETLESKEDLAKDVLNNKDGVKIVEREKTQTILNKAKTLFKKLF